MRKELQISAKFDTSDFDQAVERMQKKLKEIYAPSDMVRAQTLTQQRLSQTMPGMSGGAQTPAAQAEYQRSTMKARRDLIMSISDEAREQDKLGRLIARRNDEVKRMETDQRKMIRGSEEELKVQKQIERVRENNVKLTQQYMDRNRQLNEMMDIRERNPASMGLVGRYAQQGMYGAAGRALPGALSAGIGGLRGGLTALGGLSGGLIAAGAGVENLGGYQTRLEGARGSGIQNTLGSDLERVYGGKSPFEGQWLGERGQASAIAARKEATSRWADRMGGLGKIGAGVAAGAATGALGGSVIPFLGTGLGAIGGGIFGGVTTAMNMNDRNRTSLNPFAQGEYDQLMKSQRAKDFRETYENLKDQDPRKKLAMENFEQNYMRNLQVQRTLGIGNRGFYGGGGLLQQSAAAGFMPDQAVDMAQGIVGAGGSARMGRNATFGLQMQRSGLTNASGILGSLSSSIQSPEANKRAVIGIMSEAFKIGLDNTDFAEENRRFTQAAANIISRAGATSEGDQDRISRTLGMFMGERSNRGVEASQNAYERFQQRGSQLGGRRGQVRMASAQTNPILGKFKPDDLAELLGARPENLRSDSAFLQSYAMEASEKMGRTVTTDEILGEISKVNGQARFQIPQYAKQNERYGAEISKYMADQGLSRSQLQERMHQGKLPGNIVKAMGMQQRLISKEEAGGFNAFDIEAQQGEFLTPGGGAGPGKAGAAGMLSGAPGTRIEDTFLMEGSKGADDLRKSINELTSSMASLAEQSERVSGTITHGARAQQESQEARRATMPSNDPLNTAIMNTMSLIQPQAGKDSR